jgi:hypothetical protein
MSGHGWVVPNPDGSKARCGGPALCSACATEQAATKGEPPNQGSAGRRPRPQGPATDWLLRAEGAERALRSLIAAIEIEGYEVLFDASDATYSVRYML